MRDFKEGADISVYSTQVCFYNVHKSLVLGDRASAISRNNGNKGISNCTAKEIMRSMKLITRL
jgi:hypothetical protein